MGSVCLCVFLDNLIRYLLIPKTKMSECGSSKKPNMTAVEKGIKRSTIFKMRQSKSCIHTLEMPFDYFYHPLLLSVDLRNGSKH